MEVLDAEQAHCAPHDPTRLRSHRRQDWKIEKVLSPSDAVGDSWEDGTPRLAVYSW